jgi:hypothetical protein
LFGNDLPWGVMKADSKPFTARRFKARASGPTGRARARVESSSSRAMTTTVCCHQWEVPIPSLRLPFEKYFNIATSASTQGEEVASMHSFEGNCIRPQESPFQPQLSRYPLRPAYSRLPFVTCITARSFTKHRLRHSLACCRTDNCAC